MEAQRAEEMPLRPNVTWFGDHADPSIYWGRGQVKHLQIAIACVARAMCGVTETDCSCTASISSPNSEHRKFEFNHIHLVDMKFAMVGPLRSVQSVPPGRGRDGFPAQSPG